MKLTVEEFLKKRYEAKPSYVFDLRSVEEYESGHMMGAYSLPIDMVESNLHRLPFSGELLFHDGGEGSAQRAEEILEENGFSDTFHVDEGIEALEEALKDSPYRIKMSCKGGDTKEVKIEVIQNVLDFEINPKVAAHGGIFTLIDVEGNNVFVELGGGCQGCGMVDATLRQGVEKRLREVFPDMEELIDNTDHSEGINPYFQPE